MPLATNEKRGLLFFIHRRARALLTRRSLQSRKTETAISARIIRAGRRIPAQKNQPENHFQTTPPASPRNTSGPAILQKNRPGCSFSPVVGTARSQESSASQNANQGLQNHRFRPSDRCHKIPSRNPWDSRGPSAYHTIGGGDSSLNIAISRISRVSRMV